MAAQTSAARKLFGTDGVRGVAGEFLTAELALTLARSATARVTTDHAPRVLIIRDTRESGEMLEAAVAAGVAAAGGEALLGGVLPTPGAPLLIRRYGARARAGTRRAPRRARAPRPRAPLPRCAGGLPAGAARALRRPRPAGPSHPARLRARRDLRGRPGDLPPPRRRRRGHRRRAGRAQHQRGLRLHPRRV